MPTLACALQWFLRGQAAQSGDLGVHTVAPSSMRPWLKSPGLSRSTTALARLLAIEIKILHY